MRKRYRLNHFFENLVMFWRFSCGLTLLVRSHTKYYLMKVSQEVCDLDIIWYVLHIIYFNAYLLYCTKSIRWLLWNLFLYLDLDTWNALFVCFFSICSMISQFKLYVYFKKVFVFPCGGISDDYKFKYNYTVKLLENILW